MRFALFPLALILLPTVCKAGGTVDFDRVDDLLRQKPEVRSVLLGSLAMPEDSYAQVRLGPHFTNLGGSRVGPYTFQALPKDKTGVPVLVTLCTSVLFLDDPGNVLPAGSGQEFTATRVRELLDAVVLRDVGVGSAAACP